jgi:hypothetical protein
MIGDSKIKIDKINIIIHNAKVPAENILELWKK